MVNRVNSSSLGMYYAVASVLGESLIILLHFCTKRQLCTMLGLETLSYREIQIPSKTVE